MRSEDHPASEDLLHDKFYWNLFSGLNEYELAWLLSDDPVNSVFVYDHTSRSVERANFGLPWPVLFLLGYRHKKHRFCGKGMPDLHDIIACTSEAIDKLRWRAFFKDSATRPFCKKMMYPRKVAPFSARCDPAVTVFCHELRCSIMDSIKIGLFQSRHYRKRWANVLPIELAARHWIAQSPWVPMPTDKEGGFTLVHCSAISEIHRNLLSGPWYREFGENCLESTWRSLVPQYKRLAHQIVEVDDRVSVHVLCASLHDGFGRLPSYLINTCKTHKGAGNVSFRPVHASSRHAFLGIMSWVSMIVGDALHKWKLFPAVQKSARPKLLDEPCSAMSLLRGIPTGRSPSICCSSSCKLSSSYSRIQ